jgi:hypothetical protein
MSFLDCINTAAASGRLTAGKAEEAGAAYAEALKAGKSEGLGDAAAEAVAAMRALEETTKLKTAQRWERVNTMKKEHEIYTMLHGSKNPTNALAGHGVVAPIDNLAARVDFTYSAVTDQIMAQMDKIATEFTSRFLGLMKPMKNMDEMVHGIYGKEVEPAAKLFAEQYKATMEFSKKLLNLEGASIPENPNHRMPQAHERLAVRDAGKDAWVADHLKDGVLDWDVMEYAGKSIPVDSRAEILGRVWEAIVSEGTSTEKGAYGSASLVSRLNRERFLYYKTADSWLEMNEKYGKGNAYNQLLSHVDLTAKNVALMRHLGPNPENGIAFAKRTLENLVGKQSLDLAVKPAEKMRTAMNRELNSFGQQMDILTHKVDSGEGDALVQAANTTRSLVGTSMLGGMLSTSLSDPFYGMWFRQIHGLPFVKLIPQYIHSLMNFKDFKQQALNSGIGLESARRGMHDQARFTMMAEGNHFARTVSEAQFRLIGMSHLDDITKGNAGLDIASALAKHRETPFADIPFVELMQNLGITEKDWGLVKDTPLYEPEYYDGLHLFGKGQYMRPLDMYSNAGSNLSREAANKFLMLQELMVNGSRPMATARARTAVGGATTARSVYGQFLRSSAQFMIMPASMMFTHWRMAMAAPTALQKAARFGLLMAYTTAAGAMIQQIKEVLKNRTLANMDPIENPQFWLKSMVLGGGGAVLGDFVYNNLSASQGPFSGNNPTVEVGKKLLGAMAEPVKWAVGVPNTNVPGKEMDAAWTLLPKPQPLRFFVERSMYDAALQNVDPAAYARKRQKELEALGKSGQEELVNFQ